MPTGSWVWLGVPRALLLGLGRRGAQGVVRVHGVEGYFGFLLS
jgi:hypothetical protein